VQNKQHQYPSLKTVNWAGNWSHP